MSPEALLPFLLTSLNLLHTGDRLVGGLHPTRAKRELLHEFLVKVWGGAPGDVPREDPQLDQIEQGIRWWVPAVNALARIGGF